MLAADISLLKDINSVIDEPLYPAWLEPVGGVAYLSAYTESMGRELYKTDGSPTGMTLVKDIAPGVNDSDISWTTRVGSKVFFVANDHAHGEEVWVSDGTAAGTHMVKDIGFGSSNPENLVELNGKLYFTTRSGGSTVLWKSDGTEAGTDLVVLPDASNYPTDPKFLRKANGKLYFLAQSETLGSEPWISDGTSAGTKVLADLNPGQFSSFDTDQYPPDFTSVGNEVMFALYKAGQGKLYTSDGTSAGTNLVDSDPSIIEEMTSTGDWLFYRRGNDIYKSDGTTNTLVSSNTSQFGSEPSNFTNVGGVLYFTGSDGANHGRELWRVAVGSNQATLVVDLNPGSEGSAPFFLMNHNGALYFLASAGGYSPALWRTQGSAETTTFLKDFSEDFIPGPFWTWGSWLYFPSADPAFPQDDILWRTDGTLAGTQTVNPLHRIHQTPQPW